MSIPLRIQKIIDDLRSTPYKGSMNNRHIAVALYKGQPITSFKYNYICSTRGTMHAEMSALFALLQRRKIDPQYLLCSQQPKGKQVHV